MPKKSGFTKSNKLLKKLPTKKQTEADKKALLLYLSNEYGISYLNKYFVFKLEHIHEGSLKNLFTPIPYTTLLDMFRLYKNDLEKQRIYNKTIGKSFSDQQGLLNYDLSIILAKHSDYLNFLQEDKINSAVDIKPQETVKFVNQAIATQTGDTEKVDINEMLNDWM